MCLFVRPLDGKLAKQTKSQAFKVLDQTWNNYLCLSSCLALIVVKSNKNTLYAKVVDSVNQTSLAFQAKRVPINVKRECISSVCLLSIVHRLVSIVYCPLSILSCLLSVVHCPLSIDHSLLSIAHCLLSSVCPLSSVHCLLSIDHSLLSMFHCLL